MLPPVRINLYNTQHLTDGIIFQHNAPYVFKTDFKLLKWKYLDTATIDVEVQIDNSGRHTFLVAAGDGAMVDMTRYIKLPHSELMRLEADRSVTKCRIAGERRSESREHHIFPSNSNSFACLRGRLRPGHRRVVLQDDAHGQEEFKPYQHCHGHATRACRAYFSGKA